jgi:hypothetical protein
MEDPQQLIAMPFRVANARNPRTAGGTLSVDGTAGATGRISDNGNSGEGVAEQGAVRTVSGPCRLGPRVLGAVTGDWCWVGAKRTMSARSVRDNHTLLLLLLLLLLILLRKRRTCCRC